MAATRFFLAMGRMVSNVLPAPRAESGHIQIGCDRSAAREEVDFVLNIRRPPGRAPGVDLVWQTGKFFERVPAADLLDPRFAPRRDD